MSEKQKVIWILPVALSLVVAACSSDANSDSPDTGTDDDSGLFSNNGNNTSGGHDCDVPADCERKLDFLDPDAVEAD